MPDDVHMVWAVIALIAAGAAIALGGVGLGGFLVYRAKREAHEALFGRARQTGDVVQLQDEFEFEPVPRTVSRPACLADDDAMPDESQIMQHHGRFMDQLQNDDAGKVK